MLIRRATINRLLERERERERERDEEDVSRAETITSPSLSIILTAY